MEIKTVYTKERLMKFHKAVAGLKKPLWIFFGVCNVVCIACIVFLAWMGELSETIQFATLILVVADVLWVFFSFALPRMMVNKAKNLNLEITFSFSPDDLHIEAKNDLIEESTTVRYPFLSKILKIETELYLFISNRQGFIVDLSQVSATEQQALKQLLQEKTSVKSFKWK